MTRPSKTKTIKKPVKAIPKPRHPKHHLRATRVGDRSETLRQMHEEVEAMMDVLLGRVPPPINSGLLTLMEVSDAYFARGMEMTMQIQALEREGAVTRGSNFYKFRTGELRTFCEVAKRAAELGSRRVTYEALRVEAERTGRGSAMGNYYSEGEGTDD